LRDLRVDADREGGRDLTMAKKPRNLYVDWAVYAAVRFAVCAVQAVPLRVALGFGVLLGYLGYLVDKRHREVARDNLRHAFPELCDDPVECERLVRACYRHFGLMVVEIACIPRRLHGPIWRTMIRSMAYRPLLTWCSAAVHW
jgi:KDO2-lipid IV(A) lauroyltransferase